MLILVVCKSNLAALESWDIYMNGIFVGFYDDSIIEVLHL